MSRLEVALYSPRASYYVGGGEKIPIKQATSLLNEGHEVHFVTKKVSEKEQSFLYGELKEAYQNTIHFHELSIDQRYDYIYETPPETDRDVWNTESLALATEAHRILEKIQPNAVLNYYIVDGILRSRNTHNLIYLLGTPREKLQMGIPMMRMYDADIAISSIVRDHWSQYTKDLRHHFLLHTGVELPSQKENKPENNSKKVLFAGRLIERKGVQTLLEASKKVIGDYPDTTLTIAGDGPIRKNLEDFTQEIGIANNVNFVGVQNSEQLQELYDNSDYCVFPSYEGEGLMGVVLEAMASSKPVITTFSNGNEDIIEHLKTGYLVNPRDAGLLAQAMLFLQGHPELSKDMGKNAREHIANNLTWEQHSRKLANIIQEINRY